MIAKTIREYYLLSALFSASKGVTFATYVTFLQKNGLDFFETNLVNCVFFGVLFLSEIPTGAFADVFGRKASFIISCILGASGSFIYAQSQTFLGFIIAEAVIAIGFTFASGAFTAWFVDKLSHHGHVGKLSLVFSRSALIGQIAAILAGIAGAQLVNVSTTAPWYATSLMFAVTALVAAGLKEEYFIKQKMQWRSGYQQMKRTITSGMRYAYTSKNIRFIMLIVTVQMFALQGPNMQWQPFFRNSVGNEVNLGYVGSGILASLMIGAWFAPKLLSKITSERIALIMCQLCIGLCIILMATASVVPVALALFFLHEALRGTFGPIKDSYLHDNIASKERSTIESFESIARHIGGFFGLLVSGFLAKTFGIASTWIVCGLILSVASVSMLRFKKT